MYPSLQRVKKANGFFARFKYATFFVKLTLHEKSRFARQKVLTDVFDGYNLISRGAFAPSSSPAALLSLIRSIAFQRPFYMCILPLEVSYTVRASRDDHKSRKMLRVRRSLVHKSSENVYQPEFIRLIFVCFSYMAC